MSRTGRRRVARPVPGAGRHQRATASGPARPGRHSAPPVRRRRGRQVLAGGLVLATVVMSGGAAYAWWSGSGSGSGSAGAGTLLPLEISHDGVTPTTRLLPGQTGTVALLVHNPNPVPVRLVEVVADTDDQTHAVLPISVSGGSGCTAGNSGVSFVPQTGLSITVAVGVEWQEIELPDAVTMDLSSDNGCQGASFAIPVRLTVRTS